MKIWCVLLLQVWFQNARAKWRRMVLKQEGKSDKCGPGGVDAGPLGELELYGNSAGSGGPPMSPPFVLTNQHSPASLGSLDCAWSKTLNYDNFFNDDKDFSHYHYYDDDNDNNDEDDDAYQAHNKNHQIRFLK